MQPKNAQSRKELEKGMVDGITVRGIGHQILSKELYQEAVIISDMYDMNEFVALDLLCTAQIQMSYYPGLPRGLVAVLLYYDGRKALLSALRMLVQARKGILWCLNIRSDVERFITDYTNELLQNGLFTRIFDLLKTLDLSKELEKLQQNVALGGPKHRKQVIDLFNEIRLILGDIVFLWAAQSGLPKEQTVILIEYLREAKIEEEATGKLDNVNLYVLFAFLSSVDLSILHVREDGEEVVQSLPILSQNDFFETVLNELAASKGAWKSEGLRSVALFGFAVCLGSLRLVPQSQQLHFAIEQEEQFADLAIEMRVFEFLTNVVLENDLLYTEEFLLKRFHNLLTDFIVYMYSKVKELRIRADDTARTIQVYRNEGLEPPANLPRHFEHLMLTVAKLYSKDPLNLQLALEYWSPLDLKVVQPSTYRSPPRAVSLFKFIRLAGDVLPPTLFVPYLKMLKGLSSNPQAARYCFNMLKQANVEFNSAITWDHFFMSFAQYYTNLHQEVPSVTDTMYRRRNIFHKGITPQEIEGMHAVLAVIRTVAEYDDFSRLALCENPGWSPLNVSLGLVSCSVPIPLKADLLLTLAALSKSSEVAVETWELLESSQILITIPTTSSYQPRGIQTELDEVETHMEEYPLTRAVLTLLGNLTDSGIPRTLGAGLRKPGFDPYLNFILNSVFLKFHTRSYKNPAEKWQVAHLCLILIEKFLHKYEPHPSNFASSKSSDFNAPPGFHIMLQLNTKSELLNLIIYVIDEGYRLFSQYIPFAGKKELEDCVISCLNILDRCLTLQAKFFSLLSASPNPVLLTSLSKLLLMINPRSGKPDVCLTIASYVDFHSYIPKHSLTAIKVLTHITHSPVLHSQLMKIVLANDNVKVIKNGFVECLDNVGSSSNDADIVIAIKEKVLQLFKQCLPYTAPNFTHFLLGFDLNQSISKMHFQLPGILGFPRTCLHSLFSILKSACSADSRPLKPSLTESAYHMLYLLSTDSKTSEPVLRLLRLNQKFFRDHLDFCFKNANNGIPELNQLSWLLRTIAVEVKVTCQNNQVFYLKQLTNLLVDLPPTDADKNVDVFDIMKKSPSKYEESGVSLVTRTRVQNNLSKIILQFDFNMEEVVTPRWEYFDNSVLESIIKNCESESNPKLIDIKKLHQILIDELNTLQGNAALGQRQAIMEEIQKVLIHAVNINNTRNTAASVVRFVDSWRQVVEVLVTYVPLDTLSAKEQQVLDIQMLEEILKKIVKVNLLPEVSTLLSGAILLLLVNLRKCHIKEERQRQVSGHNSDEIYQPNIIQINATSLKAILNYIIEWLITSDVSEQKLRINLYGALVTFFHLITVDETPSQTQIDSGTYVSRLDSSKYQGVNEKSSIDISTDIASTFGEKLIDVVSQDCIGGHEVCKMLALASFSMLISISGIVNWIVHISGRGYLKHIIDSILQSDNDLRNLLEPTPENLKGLYMYEAKMSLLARIAATRVGAELLLEQKLLAYLSTMKVFDCHPEISKEWLEDEVLPDFIPSVEHRYWQLWLPALHVCNAILTSLGNDNQSSNGQILQFLMSHVNVIELVLKAANPSLSAMSLREIAIITAVISRTANNDLLSTSSEDGISQNNRAFLFRIEKLMLALLPRFVLNDGIIKDLLSKTVREDSSYRTSERLLLAMQIVSNILLYSRNLTANHDVEHSSVGVVFQPTLKDSLHVFNKQPGFTDQAPSLGIILDHLIHVVQYQNKEKNTYVFLSRKINEISEMSTMELKEFLSYLPHSYNVNLMREHALAMVSDKLLRKKKEMEYCTFIIEHCMYIIWAHLDYYMLKAIPKAKNLGLLTMSQSISLDGM